MSSTESSPVLPPIQEQIPATGTASSAFSDNRYGGMRAGRQQAIGELGLDPTLQESSSTAGDYYGVDDAIEHGNIDELHLAIGTLLVDVGQRTGDENLVEDAATNFHVTPEIAAAEFDRRQHDLLALQMQEERDDGEEDNYTSPRSRKKKKKHYRLAT